MPASGGLPHLLPWMKRHLPAFVCSPGRPRVECIPKAVAEQVERKGRQKHSEPGPEHEPWLGGVVLRRRREQVAPARGRQLDADAEERESGLEQDVLGED